MATIQQPNKAKGAAAGHLLARLIAGESVARPRKILGTTYSPGTTVGQLG